MHLSVGTAWTVPLTCRMHVQMPLPLVGSPPQGNPPGLASTAAPNLLTAAVHVFPRQIWQVGNRYVRSQRFLECVRLAVDAVSALSLRVFGCIRCWSPFFPAVPLDAVRLGVCLRSCLPSCLLSCLLVGFFTVCVCLPRAYLGMLHPPSHRLVVGRVPSCLPPSLSPVLRAAYLRLSPF